MDKALEIGKSSATGSFYLLMGIAGSTIIMAIGTLVLASLLPASDVGLYGIAFIPSNLIGIFQNLGVNYALTQQIASLRAAGKDSEIHDVMYTGIIFLIITGAILSLFNFAIAEPLAYILSPHNVATLTIYISLMSVTIFVGALANAASGIFVGFERMKLNSFTQILQAIVKTALGPMLIIIGFGVLGAIYAAVVSSIAGGVIGLILVYRMIYRRFSKYKIGKCNIKETLKPMLSYGLPLAVSSIAVGVLSQVFAFAMASRAGTSIMGSYFLSAYFVTLLTFVSYPVSTALFPVFSKLNPQKEPELMKTVFTSAVKYTSMLLVPATLLLMALSNPLINTLFPLGGLLHSLFLVNATPKYPYAPLFLTIAVLVNLLVLVGNIVLGTFQNGIRKTGQAAKQSLLSLALGLLLAYFLVAYFYSIGGPVYAVIGGLVGSFIANTPNVAWGLYWSWKNYKVKADFRNSAKILAASALAAAASYLFISFLSLPYLLLLIGGFLIFAIVYLVVAPLIGAINQKDIDNLRAMASSLGAISKILNFPLSFLEKMCQLTITIQRNCPLQKNRRKMA